MKVHFFGEREPEERIGKVRMRYQNRKEGIIYTEIVCP
jgi:hypothetical protein